MTAFTLNVYHPRNAFSKDCDSSWESFSQGIPGKKFLQIVVCAEESSMLVGGCLTRRSRIRDSRGILLNTCRPEYLFPVTLGVLRHPRQR